MCTLRKLGFDFCFCECWGGGGDPDAEGPRQVQPRGEVCRLGQRAVAGEEQVCVQEVCSECTYPYVCGACR